MRKTDWDRLVPLGICGRDVLRYMALALAAAALLSLMFLHRYGEAVDALYIARGREQILIPGAKIEPFGTLLRGCFRAMALVAAGFGILAVCFYFYHSRDGRSIYTMKRLPDRWELWRRVLTLPALGAAACAVTTALLTALYYGIYLLRTPAGCLP